MRAIQAFQAPSPPPLTSACNAGVRGKEGSGGGGAEFIMLTLTPAISGPLRPYLHSGSCCLSKNRMILSFKEGKTLGEKSTVKNSKQYFRRNSYIHT